MSDAEIERIFNSTQRRAKTLGPFAGRLMKGYFSKRELSQRNATAFGRRRTSQRLDPIRIGLIMKHLNERNGGPLSDKHWNQCKWWMRKAIRDARKNSRNSVI